MKADKATIRARVDDILRVILDGAQPWDIRQYVSQRQAAGEPPWTIPEGGNPLSERQIRRYCDIADRWMARASRACGPRRREPASPQKLHQSASVFRCFIFPPAALLGKSRVCRDQPDSVPSYRAEA